MLVQRLLPSSGHSLVSGTWWPADTCEAWSVSHVEPSPPCWAPLELRLVLQVCFLKVPLSEGQEAGRRASCSPGSLTCLPGSHCRGPGPAAGVV